MFTFFPAKPKKHNFLPPLFPKNKYSPDRPKPSADTASPQAARRYRVSPAYPNRYHQPPAPALLPGPPPGIAARPDSSDCRRRTGRSTARPDTTTHHATTAHGIAPHYSHQHYRHHNREAAPENDSFNISLKMIPCPQFGNIVAMFVVGVSGLERGYRSARLGWGALREGTYLQAVVGTDRGRGVQRTISIVWTQTLGRGRSVKLRAAASGNITYYYDLDQRTWFRRQPCLLFFPPRNHNFLPPLFPKNKCSSPQTAPSRPPIPRLPNTNYTNYPNRYHQPPALLPGPPPGIAARPDSSGDTTTLHATTAQHGIAPHHSHHYPHHQPSHHHAHHHSRDGHHHAAPPDNINLPPPGLLRLPLSGGNAAHTASSGSLTGSLTGSARGSVTGSAGGWPGLSPIRPMMGSRHEMPMMGSPGVFLDGSVREAPPSVRGG